MIKLADHQLKALDKLRSGSILCGGVGSGKSRVALAYYILKECQGKVVINGKGEYCAPKNPMPLFIITTARKRDELDWVKEAIPFQFNNPEELVVDSWNNIKKYVGIKDAFFIFDEQRVVGYGSWVKAFLKIVKNNRWILLTATPGDNWMDYVPVFIANRFYKNKTEFADNHIIYKRNTSYPDIDRFVGTKKLERLRDQIIVHMPFEKKAISIDILEKVEFDKKLYNQVVSTRWNIYKNEPIETPSQYCYILRKIVNSDPSRIQTVLRLYEKHKKVIIFYSFNYELELLKEMAESIGAVYAEWNGHRHEEVPTGKEWMYFVQYTAGAEAWNCITTDTIIFFSQHYSYKIMAQSAGRIDRMNTPYRELFYYHLRSASSIDISILRALRNKKQFNARAFMGRS